MLNGDVGGLRAEVTTSNLRQSANGARGEPGTMNRQATLWVTRFIILAALVLPTTPIPGEGTLPSPFLQLVQAAGEPPESDLPVYKPRKDNMPRARVGGAVRGLEGKDPVIAPLCPDHVGFTEKKEPTLYWYLSKATTLPIMFTLIDSRAIRPMAEVRIPPPASPGIQVIRLKEYGLSLTPDVQYKWFVSLIRDPGSPSGDVVAGGIIERVDPVESFVLRPHCADPMDAVCMYAQNGLWYDAVAAVSELIESSPKDCALRRKRAFLLQQVGLSQIADYDLKTEGMPCPPVTPPARTSR